MTITPRRGTNPPLLLLPLLLLLLLPRRRPPRPAQSQGARAAEAGGRGRYGGDHARVLRAAETAPSWDASREADALSQGLALRFHLHSGKEPVLFPRVDAPRRVWRGQQDHRGHPGAHIDVPDRQRRGCAQVRGAAVCDHAARRVVHPLRFSRRRQQETGAVRRARAAAPLESHGGAGSDGSSLGSRNSSRERAAGQRRGASPRAGCAPGGGGAPPGGGGPELLRRVPSTDAEEEARPQIHLVVRSSRPAYHVMQR
mmetsp:Transcript_63564/g.152053  ORF Transcript_63564/g.152053 Transcript_63564/m.152053 type:complete len:256 (+) Transcript_63564:318-1085(+)